MTKQGMRAGASTLLLVVVIGAPAAASWHGLTAAGRDALGLPGAWSALVPLVVDAAAAYAAVLALRDVIEGDAAGVNRLLVWCYALASAGLNVWHAERIGGVPAAVFYGLASVSAVVLWDRTLRAARRDTLRALGAVAAPAPRFRMARWVVAPGETARAWRLAVIEGVCEPGEAVRLARAPRAVAAPTADVGALISGDGRAYQVVDEVAGLSKADAVRAAVAALGVEAAPTAVVAWLQTRGLPVAPSYVSDVTRRDRGKQTTETADLRLAS